MDPAKDLPTTSLCGEHQLPRDHQDSTWHEIFDWAKDKITEYSLDKICTLLFSPTFGKIDPQLIVEWILVESLPVRMQMQMHKMIWSPDKQGV